MSESSWTVPALHRLEHQGWIRSKWGTSENGRRAKFYSPSAAGRRQLETETAKWRRLQGTSGGLFPGEARRDRRSTHRAAAPLIDRWSVRWALPIRMHTDHHRIETPPLGVVAVLSAGGAPREPLPPVPIARMSGRE